MKVASAGMNGDARMRRAALAAALLVSACASTPERPPSVGPTQPEAVAFALRAADFSDLPGWAEADLAPALLALRRACAGRSARAADAPISNAGRYGGTVGDWSNACANAQLVQP